MNYKMIGRIIALILIAEVIFMTPALMICLFDGTVNATYGFLIAMAAALVFSAALLIFARNPKKGFYVREGFVCVGLSWIALSLFGALPFFFSGEIPSYLDAVFETVSGFTTTGSSILTDVESMSRGLIYWRSFSHWLGGMGVLVFILAVVPLSGKSEGFTMHLLRAESPGPNVGKLVPRIKRTASILYLLYIALTLSNMIFLLVGKMPFFDAVCTALGTAGTGGFGIKNDSLAGYSHYIQTVTTVFMLLFAVNFSCYYMLLLRRFKDVLKDEELHMFAGIVFGSIALITFNISGIYGNAGEALHHAAFQVASIISTSGFATADFDLWPAFSKAILFLLMAVGACAGSTGGGFKVGRLLILIKSAKRSILKMLHPNKIQIVRINDEVVDEGTIEGTNTYLAIYVFIIVVSFLIVSTSGFSITTGISAVVSCFNNIGPGFDAVGPTCNFSALNAASKVVLIVDMLAGRLEIFPILLLFSHRTWNGN